MKNNWFKILISICVIAVTLTAVYYVFVFLPEERNYVRSEAKRFECKQEVGSLYAQFNSVAQAAETEEEKQQVAQFGVQLGVLDSSGMAVNSQDLMQDCINNLE